MRYYNSKNVEREYVVVKHQLRIDTELLGVRYREGYGVVAKNSKEYYNLKQIKMAVTVEYPLTKLKTLKCITNPAQVKTIWGVHIYKAYMIQMQEAREALAEKAKEQEELTTVSPASDYISIVPFIKLKCKQTTKSGDICKNDAIEVSCFCKKHIHFDKRIADKLIEAGDMEKPARAVLIDKWISELE